MVDLCHETVEYNDHFCFRKENHVQYKLCNNDHIASETHHHASCYKTFTKQKVVNEKESHISDLKEIVTIKKPFNQNVTYRGIFD